MIFAATSRVFWPLYVPRMRLRSGLRPNPAGRAYSPDPLADGEEPLPAVGLNLPPPPFGNSFRRH